jgi:hypothetical protein
MDFNTGNVIKYLWRAGLKFNNEDSNTAKLRDMKKALFYLQDEIKLIEEVKEESLVGTEVSVTVGNKTYKAVIKE